MNPRKGELTPAHESEPLSAMSGGPATEWPFSSREGNHCKRECAPDLKLRLAPPRATELAQAPAKGEAFRGSGAAHAHVDFRQEPGSEADRSACCEQISCRESFAIMCTTHARPEAERNPLTDAVDVAVSTDIDRKQKQAVAPFSQSSVSKQRTLGEAIAGSNFSHAHKLQQQHMAVTPELTPFHLALGAQQQTELCRRGWDAAVNNMGWAQVIIPGVQEQDSKAIPQVLLYGGYGHHLEVSNATPRLSQSSRFHEGNACAEEREKQQATKMLISSTHYISEQSRAASGGLYLGSESQGQEEGNTGCGAVDPKCWLNSSMKLTAEVGACVPSSNTAVKEITASASCAPVVGWPPVQSFRKNSATTHCQTKPRNKCQAMPIAGASTMPSPSALQSPRDGGFSSLFVKVYMDGILIGRKVDLKAYSSYEKLSLALEEMFEQFVLEENFPSKREKLSPIGEKKPSFLHGSDYIMTYEDKDGDLMLVGDVPWSLFTRTVKRLRIMKGCETTGFDIAKEKVMNR